MQRRRSVAPGSPRGESGGDDATTVGPPRCVSSRGGLGGHLATKVGPPGCVRSRGVNFEKWQALGNDYVILDERALTFELTPGRIRRLCDPHFGIGGDGVVLVSEPSEPGFVARLRIFNPDGSESNLSGNGFREAVLYLRRHRWTDDDRFSLQR